MTRRAQRASVLAGALETVAEGLEARLDAAGWTRSNLMPYKLALFTRQVGTGDYFQTLDLVRVGQVKRHDDWPAELCWRFGCGYWPATELMRRVGLDLDLTLVEEPNEPGKPRYRFTRLTSEADARRVVDEVEADVSAHGSKFAEASASEEAVERALRDPELTPDDVRIELLPVFLASTGRIADAIEAAKRYLDADVADDQDEYAAFVQQLSNLDTGKSLG